MRKLRRTQAFASIVCLSVFVGLIAKVNTHTALYSLLILGALGAMLGVGAELIFDRGRALAVASLIVFMSALLVINFLPEVHVGNIGIFIIFISILTLFQCALYAYEYELEFRQVFYEALLYLAANSVIVALTIKFLS